MNNKALQLNKVSRSFGTLEVLRELSLDIMLGEFVAVVGPSGCGKSTLLNLLSGYDQPSSGAIHYGEREGREGRKGREGRVRMVYQQDGLFPWQTVAENIALGLRHISDEEERGRQVSEMISLIRLEGFENHYPHQLSGGMRQRVQLARALAGDSDILLLDEPFSALDYLTRIRMRQELAHLLLEWPRTVALVTHDIEEAAQLADRVIVLSERPARIRCELSIEAPRPRDLTHSMVVRATHRILAVLGFETDKMVRAQTVY